MTPWSGGQPPPPGPPPPAGAVGGARDAEVARGERRVLWQDMTISRDAFVRNLPGAVAHAPFCAHGDDFVHDGPDRGWRIRLTRLPDRVIASLALERHAVEIHLRGYDAEGERAFLERFELHFRRGGG